ncbi:hypothetical protein Vretimale_635, partial [Volvox reticuliferus]
SFFPLPLALDSFGSAFVLLSFFGSSFFVLLSFFGSSFFALLSFFGSSFFALLSFFGSSFFVLLSFFGSSFFALLSFVVSFFGVSSFLSPFFGSALVAPLSSAPASGPWLPAPCGSDSTLASLAVSSAAPSSLPSVVLFVPVAGLGSGGGLGFFLLLILLKAFSCRS